MSETENDENSLVVRERALWIVDTAEASPLHHRRAVDRKTDAQGPCICVIVRYAQIVVRGSGTVQRNRRFERAVPIDADADSDVSGSKGFRFQRRSDGKRSLFVRANGETRLNDLRGRITRAPRRQQTHDKQNEQDQRLPGPERRFAHGGPSEKRLRRSRMVSTSWRASWSLPLTFLRTIF